MSIRIAIVEDDRDQAARVAQMAGHWDAKAEIATYESAEALLFDVQRAFDVLILDIQMPGMDGMALAKTLRVRGATAQMIFVTAFPDYMAEGYDVDAVNYLLKPVSREKLSHALDRARERLSRARRTVMIGGERFFADEIVSCEAKSRGVLIKTDAGVRLVRVTMNELENALGAGFFRCQRSFFANIDRVRRLTRTGLEMDDGSTVPLSRGLYDAANRAFIDQNWRER
jgi:DNA-binding LytR/AlgR family response regulator